MVGVKLKELRELNGSVQRHISALLEIDKANINTMESGVKNK
jgi:transcriptional regulator with XRE-family HTH domain